LSFLPFSRPSYVKASKSRIRRAYVIEAVGLAGATVYGVVIDGRVALEPYLNTSSLIVLPLSNLLRRRSLLRKLLGLRA